MEYTLLVDQVSGNVRFWMERVVFLSFYDVVMQHWHPRQWKFEEQTYRGEFPADWAENWPDYKLVDGTLVRGPEPGVNKPTILRSIDHVNALVASYKNHVREFASRGLPTTAIGFAKLEALANIGYRWQTKQLDARDKAQWVDTAAKLWPSMTPDQAADHVYGLQKVMRETTWMLIQRGSLV